jgi:hypothetical protein
MAIENISALAAAPGGEAFYLASAGELLRLSAGVGQSLYKWPEAILEPLAVFSRNGAAVAERMNNGEVVVIGLPQGEILTRLRVEAEISEWPISLGWRKMARCWRWRRGKIPSRCGISTAASI